MSIANPIRTPAQIPASVRKALVWEKPSEEWLTGLKESKTWWYQGVTKTPHNEREAAAMEKALKLRDRLLTFGGDIACMDLYDPDVDKILERGEFLGGAHARRAPGERSHCHQNSAGYYLSNKGRVQIMTGYALSDDGCWRQHSWLVEPMLRSWRVWETTVKRIAYYGVILTPAECDAFADYVFS